MKKIIRKYINESKINKIFDEWFGESKVVDKNDNPLMVYHGGAKFNQFRIPETDDKGVYFTDNYYFALYFAIQHELVERDERNDDYKDIPDEMLNSGDWDEKYLKYSEVKKAYLKIEKPKIFESIVAGAIPRHYNIKFDGIIAKTTGDFGYSGGQYVVFDNEQIWLLK